MILGSSLTSGFLGGSLAHTDEPIRLVRTKEKAKKVEKEKRISLQDRLFKVGL
jgi:hypothetical protein